MGLSYIMCRELWASLVIEDECELVGMFELESAECGDTGEPPLVINGRTIAWISKPDEVVAVIVVGCVEFDNWSLLLLLLPLPLVVPFWLPLLVVVSRIGPFSLPFPSPIEISTCGVRKCIGGVALSFDRAESPESLNAFALAFAAAANAGKRWAEFDCSNASNNDEGVPVPGLSKSMPCRLKKWTRSDFIVPAR